MYSPYIYSANTASTGRRCPDLHSGSRRGAALVELAIVVPGLLLITLICIDFGCSAGAYLVLSNAARAGADYGATHGFTNDSYATWESFVNAAIQQEMANMKSYNAGQLQTAISTTTNSDGTIQVVVALSYTFQTVVSWTGFPASIPLSCTVEMRQYQ